MISEADNTWTCPWTAQAFVINSKVKAVDLIWIEYQHLGPTTDGASDSHRELPASIEPARSSPYLERNILRDPILDREKIPDSEIAGQTSYCSWRELSSETGRCCQTGRGRPANRIFVQRILPADGMDQFLAASSFRTDPAGMPVS